MNFILNACVDASMSQNGRSAGISGEVLCGYSNGTPIICYQYDIHVPINNIHDAEWCGVLIAAYYLNSWEMHGLIRANSRARYIEATIYTDRRCNLNRACACMAFYYWNFQRMYRCDLLVAHMDRDQDWLRQQNNRARQARLLPLGTERAWGLPWLQPMHRQIQLVDVLSAYHIVVPSNMWMRR